MNTSIEQMLAKYQAETIEERKNAVKEITQEIVLCGLSRAGFFDKAAFYGGSALRIFYGLDRFSEDLDFALLQPDLGFDLKSFFPMIQKEVNAYGLKFDVEEKKKSRDFAIRSAFLKGNTREHLLLFYPRSSDSGIPTNELIKIKFEIDTDPPGGASYEHRYSLLPSPYQVNLYDLPSLFAGKIHAVLCRAWRNRVKGRDLYDYVFYLSRGADVNLTLLKAKLTESGVVEEGDSLNRDQLRSMLYERFDTIDYESAKEDVIDFIDDKASLDVWSADFFRQITGNL
ncbi:MAG: nucleotidyl transferase AbiEii/AbiGii toxin family protein [Mogibacterium sp.]|nr:nucleotidyl transferase AbiEii/AbiGii toxin family protein [Mogibacterium sp.]